MFLIKPRAFLLVLFCCSTFCVSAQTLTVSGTEFKSGKLVVHYNLVDSVEGRSYIVRMYSSADGFLSPLVKLAGDAGIDIKPGLNKTIEWDLIHELTSVFHGPLAIEVKARVLIPFINTSSIDKYKVFKRSRNYNLTWTGGSSQNVLNFDLYRGERKVASFPNIGNSGHHTFRFPNHIKPGKNYRFRISDAKNQDEVVYTNVFRIKPLVPLAFKVIPAIAAGAVLYGSLGGDEAINPEIGKPPRHP